MQNDDVPFVTSFVSDVRTALCSCGVEPADLAAQGTAIGAAVSGGADSISLLVALSYIAKETGVHLHVITVNHNIRPAEETGGDAAYVQQMCTRFAAAGMPVDCTLRELEKGAVEAAACERGNGTEEAARWLRYAAFEAFANEKHTACICLAHNRNDQLETLLMRFLQGSGGAGGAGIQQVRGMFVRPLLDVPRTDIEHFLTVQHIAWRTDSTNSDIRYLRNRIRHVLMPELDRTVPGWRTAVIAGGRKAAESADLAACEAEKVDWVRTGTGVCMSLALFAAQHAAVQTALLYSAFNAAGTGERVPYSFIERIRTAAASQPVFCGNAAGIAVCIQNGSISVKKSEKPATDLGFSAIIEETGTYELPFGKLTVIPDGTGGISAFVEDCAAAVIPSLSVPFCIRSRQLGDEIRTADGGTKSVSDILSDWKVTVDKKEQIPVIQNLTEAEEPVVCVWGSVFGYDDWIVLPQEK